MHDGVERHGEHAKNDDDISGSGHGALFIEGTSRMDAATGLLPGNVKRVVLQFLSLTALAIDCVCGRPGLPAQCPAGALGAFSEPILVSTRNHKCPTC
jgi:hypothetical protein